MIPFFDRSGTRSVKWATAGAEADPHRIPLGVADMDLPGFPALFDALRERMAHPALGYTLPAPDSRELVAAWYRDGFGARIDPAWVVRLPFGPRAAVRFLLDAVDGPGPVLAPGPEYAGFAQVARAAGLAYEAIALERAADGRGYRLPVEEFEARAGSGPVRAVVLSSPHNPTGRVWSHEEIRRLARAAAGAGGVLISDEVHSDLVHPGRVHPVAVAAAGEEGLAEHTVTVHSVGKTFNVSGLADAFALVPSPRLRERLVRAVEGHGFFEGGRVLPALAQDTALARGRPWRDRLVAYLAANRELAVGALAAVPGLVACEPEASYLLWLDGSALPVPAGRSAREHLLAEWGLDVQDGAAYGPDGAGFLRLNLALPRPQLEEALARLAAAAAQGAPPSRDAGGGHDRRTAGHAGSGPAPGPP
ncbi:cystathionine beta-lyase PatB [Streptomyces capparidis]